MLSVNDALAKVTDGFKPLGIETVSLDQALGRALAEDAASRLSHPPVAVSAMDGYAVRHEDVASVPCHLTQIGMSQAGHAFEGTVNAGETVRIFTGAPLPAGADTIVIQENTRVEGETIEVQEAAKPKQFVRPAGLDFNIGEVLLKRGRVLTARDIGLLASMNIPWVKVRRKPRVAFMGTGDEIVMPGDPLGPDQIVSSNSLAVAAYITALGGVPVNLGIARDTEDSLLETLKGARGADLLITIGGASVGDYDLVQSVMRDEGLDLGFYKIAMRPGKPLIFGQLKDVPVLGLPGNPVSAGVTSALFMKAAMDVMLGLNAEERAEESVLLGTDLKANDGRQDYLRAQLRVDDNGAQVAMPFSGQDSSMMARFAHADCLIIRRPHAEPAKKGDWVNILRLGFGRIGF